MAPIAPSTTREPREASVAIPCQPPLHRPQRQAMLAGHLCQWDGVFHTGL